jgi:hypothetical protein
MGDTTETWYRVGGVAEVRAAAPTAVTAGGRMVDQGRGTGVQPVERAGRKANSVADTMAMPNG